MLMRFYIYPATILLSPCHFLVQARPDLCHAGKALTTPAASRHPTKDQADL